MPILGIRCNEYTDFTYDIWLSVAPFISFFVATIITMLVTHVLPLFVTLLLHIMTIFTPFPCRIESFPPVMIPISRKCSIFTVTECMDFIDVIPAEFGRKPPLSYLYPITTIRGRAIPAASPCIYSKYC